MHKRDFGIFLTEPQDFVSLLTDTPRRGGNRSVHGDGGSWSLKQHSVQEGSEVILQSKPCILGKCRKQGYGL